MNAIGRVERKYRAIFLIAGSFGLFMSFSCPAAAKSVWCFSSGDNVGDPINASLDFDVPDSKSQEEIERYSTEVFRKRGWLITGTRPTVRCNNSADFGGRANYIPSWSASNRVVSDVIVPPMGRNTGGMAYSPDPGTRRGPIKRNGVVTSPPTAPRPAAAAYADMACFTVGYRTDENVGNGIYRGYVYVSSVFSSSFRNSAEARFNDYVRTRYGRNSQGSPILNLYKSTCSSNDPQNVAVDGEASAQRDGGVTSVKVIHTYWQPQ